jgi:hypothetical protein
VGTKKANPAYPCRFGAVKNCKLHRRNPQHAWAWRHYPDYKVLILKKIRHSGTIMLEWKESRLSGNRRLHSRTEGGSQPLAWWCGRQEAKVEPPRGRKNCGSVGQVITIHCPGGGSNKRHVLNGLRRFDRAFPGWRTASCRQGSQNGGVEATKSRSGQRESQNLNSTWVNQLRVQLP